MAGYTYNVDFNNDFALARYTADGKLDSSFGVNGKVLTDFDSSNNYAGSIALQQDKIIVAGNALARYTADGRLDSTFGENGKVIINLEGSSSIGDIALYENRLYAVGSTNQFDGTYGVVAAYQLETSEPSISIADVTVTESKRLAVVTVRLSAPATQRVHVNYTLRNKTAVRNQDYIDTSGPLLFIPGFNNTTAKVIIPIVDNSEAEGDEQFEIVLTNARNATIQDSVAVVTIIDDDALITKEGPSLQIKASPNPSKDGFAIQLQGRNLIQQVSVRVYDISGRLLEERANVGIGQRLRLGNQFKVGAYIIEAVQGNRKVQTKAIKTGK